MNNEHKVINCILYRRKPLAAFVLIMACVSGESYAERVESDSSSQGILEEVVVTAARGREEDVQSTPVAVTAMTGEMLQKAQITNMGDVGKLAPNLQITKSVSTGDVATVYLRGFGTFGADIATDPKVAIFIDGIYQPAAVGTLLDTFDVDRIEVQAGPQGTLLGKNAPIGAIYVASEKPTGDYSGAVQVDYGSYDRAALRGKVNFPILTGGNGDTILAGRASFWRKNGGDWVKNLTTGKRQHGGEDTTGGRLSLALTPNDRFEWQLTSLIDRSRAPQTGARAANYFPSTMGDRNTVAQSSSFVCVFVPDSCVPKEYGTTASAFNADTKGDTFQIASTMDYSFDPATLTFVAGYYDYERKDNQDVGGEPFVILNVYEDEHEFDQKSAELRLRSNTDGALSLDGKLDWVVGAYYSEFDYTSENNIAIFGSPVGQVDFTQAQKGETKSEALFMQSIYHVSDALSTTVGVRKSWDEKSHVYAPPGYSIFFDDGTENWSDTSYEASIAYQVDDDRMVYFRFAQGYAAGGFVGFPQGPGLGNAYDPETNDAYEIGVKSDWFDNKLRVNLNLFRNELDDLQVAGTIPTNAPPFYQQTTTNAASATVQGVESQIIFAPTEALTARLTVGYLDASYDEYEGTVCSNVVGESADCSGVPFALAPEWTVDTGIEYIVNLPNSGEIEVGAGYSYKSGLYTADAPAPSSYQSGFGLLNLRAAYNDPTDSYSLELYGTNVLDKEYLQASTAVPGFLVAWNDGRPAEVGVRLTWRFSE
jgi:iron complex outermembrane recepter protein